jgi:NagD protein
MHDVGFVMTERDPDYVVLGETRTYSFESITRAIRLIEKGARFIATNPDPSGPSPAGTLPATGSVAALISTATGRQPYYVGKPNPFMMRSAPTRSTPTPRPPSWSATGWTPTSSAGSRRVCAPSSC